MRASEKIKVDMALETQEIGIGDTEVGEYFPMSKYGEALFVVTTEELATGETMVIQVRQATDRDGSDSELLDNATATIDPDALQPQWEITVDTVLENDQLSISDSLGQTTVLTAVDGTPGVREFDQSGTNDECAASLAEAIQLYVPGANATASTNEVTLLPDEPGERVFTVHDTAATITEVVDGIAAGAVAVKAEWLEENSTSGEQNTHIAVSCNAVGANIDTSAVIIRSAPRYSPSQHLAALSEDLD